MSRGQLVARGLSAKSVDRLLGDGWLHPVLPGVYAVGRREVGQHGHWMAAVLAGGARAVLSHRSAAELWGLCSRREMWREITIPPDCDRRPLDLVVHRRKVDPAEVTKCERIPVTAPFRTLLDLASYLRPREVEAAVNEAVKLDLVELETMRRALDDLPPRAGKRLLAKLIHAPEFRLTDSELERRFLRLIARAGLVAPDTGVELCGFKTDFSWEGLRLVVETDGLRFHRSPSQQARDRVRDQTLTAAGFTVLRFTHQQVRYEPAHVLATLKTVATRLHEHRLGD